MSTSSKNTCKTKTKPENSEQPFKESVLREAEKIVNGYHIIIEKNDKLGFVGSSLELPTVYADGKTPQECFNAIQKALTVAAATMIECGKKPPEPFSAKKRNIQVNIRLNNQEKLLLSDTARRSGFKGLSDFIRMCALEHIIHSTG